MNLQCRRKRDRFVWRRRAGLLSGGSFPTKSTCFCWTWWAFPLGARTPWNILLKDSWCSFLHLKHNFTQLWHRLVGLTDPLILEDLPDSQVWEVWVLRCPPASHGRTRSPAHYSHVFIWLLIALAILTPASQRSFFNMCFTRIRQGHTSHWVFPPQQGGPVQLHPRGHGEQLRLWDLWRWPVPPGFSLFSTQQPRLWIKFSRRACPREPQNSSCDWWVWHWRVCSRQDPSFRPWRAHHPSTRSRRPPGWPGPSCSGRQSQGVPRAGPAFRGPAAGRPVDRCGEGASGTGTPGGHGGPAAWVRSAPECEVEFSENAKILKPQLFYAYLMDHRLIPQVLFVFSSIKQLQTPSHLHFSQVFPQV